MKNYSKNAKLNKVLNEIRDQLLSIHDTEDESLQEIKRYVDYKVTIFVSTICIQEGKIFYEDQNGCIGTKMPKITP